MPRPPVRRACPPRCRRSWTRRTSSRAASELCRELGARRAGRSGDTASLRPSPLRPRHSADKDHRTAGARNVNELDPPTRFNGLDNFRILFSDTAVRSSLGNTALYVVIGVALSTVLGVVMAVTLQRPIRGRSVVIAIIVLPWALPGVVEGIVWTGIWDSNTGLLNSLLTSAGLIDHYQVFLGQNRLLTIFAIELVHVWQITPLSALLPLARPGTAIAMVQAVIATLNVFDQPYVLNGAAPAGASVTMQTYFISFQNLDIGEGYALSLLITVATLIVSLLVVKLVYRSVEY